MCAGVECYLTSAGSFDVNLAFFVVACRVVRSRFGVVKMHMDRVPVSLQVKLIFHCLILLDTIGYSVQGLRIKE